MDDYVDADNPEALLDYYAQYLNNPNAISAAPALNHSALLKPTEYGPSIPALPPSTSMLPKRDSSQAAPYPAGYAGATSLAAKATAVARPSTVRIVEDRKRTNFNTPTSSSISGSNPLRKTSVLRQGGGKTWADDSLLDWDENDFRIFVGDIGNDTTDDMLYNAFSKYPSLQKARVIRDKKSAKTKGYGFVSLKDPRDFLKALKEMDGKYIGGRPIKVSKSSWKDRNLDVKSLGKQKLPTGGVSKKK